jgi:serine acetyltransferase
MQTSPLDFILSGAFITAILAGALSVAFLSVAGTRAAFGEYHVIVDFFLVLLGYGLLSAVAVQAMLKLRRIHPGEYSMDSPVFTYWKLLTVLYRLGQGALLPFTPVFAKPLIEMLFGAKIGANVALGGTIDDPYMVTIGDGAVLGNGSLISGNVITKGKIRLGTVTIGAGATVGANSVVLPGSEIGNEALIMGGAFVLADSKVPAGQTWRGNPARKWQ